MSIGEVADGCGRAIELIREGIERTIAAREKYASARSRLSESLTEQSSRHDALTSPYDAIDEALTRATGDAAEAIESIEAYVAFILGTGAPDASTGSSSVADPAARDRTTTGPVTTTRPGDTAPVSPEHRERFDPHIEPGALGDSFRRAVHLDPRSRDPFQEHEVFLAEHLVDTYSVSVHERPIVDGVTNPDAIIRTGPDDPGRYAEFKSPKQASTKAVLRSVTEAAKQLAPYGGGDLYIDGRRVDLDEATARQGYARAAGQARAHGQAMPERTWIILGDGRIITLGEGRA